MTEAEYISVNTGLCNSCAQTAVMLTQEKLAEDSYIEVLAELRQLLAIIKSACKKDHQ